MSSGRGFVEVVLANSTVELTLEEAVERILLTVADMLSQASDNGSTATIIRNLQVLISGHIVLIAAFGKQISDLLVINFGVTDADRDCLIELARGQRVNLADGSGHDAAVLVDSGAACHRVGLTSSCLAVAHDGAVVSFNN